MKYIITESQYHVIKGSLEKNKKFLTNYMGIDFDDKIKMITSVNDVPSKFIENISWDFMKRALNYWGPMYLFNFKGIDYIYQDRGEFEWFIDEDGFEFVDDEIIEDLGIDVLGLKFSNIINLFHNEE